MAPLRPLLRRTLLGALGAGGLVWAAPFATGRDDAATPKGKRLIVLWLDGGPSQLETFDPKPGTRIGGPTRSLKTSLRGVEIAEGLERTAEICDRLAIIRSLAGKEGDHERARHLMVTGYRPDPTVAHASLGAIATAELADGDTEIPPYVSILGDRRHAGGGLLGARYNAFLIGDPKDPIPDVRHPVDEARFDRRLDDLAMLESSFAEAHPAIAEQARHVDRTEGALRTMRSAQLAAFDVADEPSAVRAMYGDHAFGRGCLAARRLTDVGVSCVEVTLGGWDTHVSNYESTRPLVGHLDDGLSALVRDLEERDRLRDTLVVCVGEFGRTPRINAADGRDHWPDGFCAVLAGAGIRTGQLVGATDPDEGRAVEPTPVGDLAATILSALGVDPAVEVDTPLGRPVKYSEGKPIARLLRALA